MDNSNKKQTLLEKLKTIQLSPQWIFASVLSSFMMAYIFQMLYNNIFYELEAYYNSINFVVFFVIAIFGAVFLCYLTYIMKSRAVIPRALLITTFLLSFMFCCSYFEDSIYFILGIACVDLIVILWLTKDDKLELSKIKLNYKTCLISACVLFLFTSVYFGYFTSLRYQSFTNATFDFGIFTQMFDNMSETFLPVTTVERSVEMSHFGVHFSPIYYLYLPLYMIFRSPFYLLYAQAISVALGVFAVYLICKKSGIPPKITFCFELIYCFYPCLFNGCFYDFHENKILTTIILFLFYFIICDKRIPIFVFSLLLLMVKEDAAIYLIVIALYVLINKKKLINGLTMLTMAVVYFVVANNIVSALGTEGVMIDRLNDYFINGEKKLRCGIKKHYF